MSVGNGRAARVAIAQLCSSKSKLDNFETCKSLVARAKEQNARFVCFPEAFEFMGQPGKNDSLGAAEYLSGPTLTKYKELAKEQAVWLSLGGFHEKLSEEGTKIANTHVIVDDSGEIKATYRKMHLFDVDYDGGYRESDSTARGDEVVVVRDTPIGSIGVTTCYDLRFPGLYSTLRDMGADVFLIPSAFMPTTGLAHWHVLLRSRAIENQCFVVASAQAGKHNEELGGRIRESFGHSLAVDPFGKILCDMEKSAPSISVVELDFEEMKAVRERMPVQMHRHQTQHIIDRFDPSRNQGKC